MSGSPRASSEITALAPDRQKDLREICALWDQAEKRLKRSEQALSELSLPAANQLRYAGYHLARSVEAFDANDWEAYGEQIRRARSHCKRAIYDAAEALLNHLHGRIERFRDDYANVHVTPVLPDYLTILGRAAEARRLVTGTAAHDRDSFHDEAERCCDQLEQDCERLDIAREELNKTIREKRDTFVRWAAPIAVALVVGLMTIAATLIAPIIGARASAPPAPPQKPASPSGSHS